MAFWLWFWLTACAGSVDPFPPAQPFSRPLDPEPSSARTHHILTALILEQRQDYRSAWGIWSRLPDESPAVREHRFMTELMMRSELPRMLPLDSESAVLLAASYLRWHLDWDQAFRLLQRYQPKSGNGMAVRLEMIRLALLLGRYQTAADWLNITDDGLSAAERFGLAMLKSWHALLTEDWETVRTTLTALADDDRFAHYETRYPVWLSIDTDAEEDRLLRQAIRFPSDRTVLDDLLTVQRQAGNWRSLEAALKVQPSLPPEPVDWRLVAAVYRNTDRFDLLEQLLEAVERDAGTSLDYFAYAAQAALLTEDWERLRAIAVRYRRLYPELDDGDWFLKQLPVEASRTMR